MGAKQGNENAKKERTRVAACLSIADERDYKRLSWAIARIKQEQNIDNPTDQQISRFVKDWCYTKIDQEAN